MNISTNDHYKDREEIMETLNKYILQKDYEYIIKHESTQLTAECMYKKEFNCTSIFIFGCRKKGTRWCVRKARVTHNCPSGYKAEFGVMVEYLKRKVLPYIDYRIGRIVEEMHDQNINLNYKTAFELTLKLRPAFFPNHKIGFIKHDSFNISNQAMKCFLDEMVSLNNSLDYQYDRKNVFIEQKGVLKSVRNVIDIKYYISNVTVIYAIVYDHENVALIHSIALSETSTINELMDFFLKRFIKNYRPTYDETSDDQSAENISNCNKRKRGRPRKETRLINNKLIFIIPYDNLLILKFKEHGLPFLLKTRSLCQKLFEEIEDFEFVRTTWDLCNSIYNIDFKLETFRRTITKQQYEKFLFIVDELEPSNYIIGLSGQSLYGLNNINDLEIDYIPVGIYDKTMLDCLSSIVTLYSDLFYNLREKYRKEKCDFIEERLFAGYKNIDEYTVMKDNVICRHNKIYTVNLNQMQCSCKLFQEYKYPCVHAYSYAKIKGFNHLNYISKLYHNETIHHFISDNMIVPVVDEQIKTVSDKRILPKLRKVKNPKPDD